MIVLCYQANEAIHRVIDPLYEQLEASGIAYELLLVANQWSDRPDPTGRVVEAFATDHEDTVRTVIEDKQGAMGWDMRSGLAAAAGDYLVVIDGDAQNPVDDVLKMYRRMRATRRRRDEGPADRPLRRAVPARDLHGLQPRLRRAVRHARDLGRQRQAEGADPRGV